MQVTKNTQIDKGHNAIERMRRVLCVGLRDPDSRDDLHYRVARDAEDYRSAVF